jgi:hypothetical protein
VSISLPDVTLVSIDTVCPELTKMAITDCIKHVDFGDIKVFTSDSIKDSIRIEPFTSLQHACDFTTYEIPKYIKTSHCLFIHYDSWVLDPAMWRDEYLAYDYVGAPWWYKDGLNVGNSGFCLRSLDLLNFLATNSEEYPTIMPEDNTLCRVYRPRLPQFKWAPEEAAQAFAFERVRPALDSRHFGFHGMFNWPFVLSYEGFNERMAAARRTPYLQQGTMLKELDGVWFSRWGHAYDAPIRRG